MTKALDARDGMAPSMLTNGSMMNAMQSVDSNPLWSILDDKGTQTMMKQLLGEAGSVTDFDTVQKRLRGLVVLDGLSARREVRPDHCDRRHVRGRTVSSLLTAAVMVRKMSASDAEKQALSATDIGSDAGKLVDSLCQFGHGVRSAAAIAAVPDHGEVRRTSASQDIGLTRVFLPPKAPMILGGI